MESSPDDVPVHFVEHGAGRPVVVLHGAGVDHREAEACFDPLLGELGTADGGMRRVYPDLPGMGETAAPDSLTCADDVLEVLVRFVDELAEERGGGESVLLVGHSAGGYYARGLAVRRPDLVGGLALVCPLLDDVRAVPEHQPVVAAPELGDAGFRDYFVVQTPAMLERYQRFVAPAVPLADPAAAERIGAHWQLTQHGGGTFAGPTLIVAGRLDATVGYAAAADLLPLHQRATLAVLDGAGHALPHESPELLGALIRDWVARCG